MYSFHPFGGLSSHPYGGSVSGAFDLNMKINPGDAAKQAGNIAKDKAVDEINRRLNKRKKQALPKPGPAVNAASRATAAYRTGMAMLDTMKINMGKSQAAANATMADAKLLANARAKLSPSLRFTPAIQEFAQQAAMEQSMMAVGGEAEEGFLSKYKNFVIIGGAVAVVGVAAFFMLRK